jgi:hypothetical protein
MLNSERKGTIFFEHKDTETQRIMIKKHKNSVSLSLNALQRSVFANYALQKLLLGFNHLPDASGAGTTHEGTYDENP